nr:hypothetical protein [Bacillus wiedmannii]
MGQVDKVAESVARNLNKNQLQVVKDKKNIMKNKQKGTYGEIKSSDNLLNNQSLKEAGFDLKPVGKSALSGINDKIVKELMDYTKIQMQNQRSNTL